MPGGLCLGTPPPPRQGLILRSHRRHSRHLLHPSAPLLVIPVASDPDLVRELLASKSRGGSKHVSVLCEDHDVAPENVTRTEETIHICQVRWVSWAQLTPGELALRPRPHLEVGPQGWELVQERLEIRDGALGDAVRHARARVSEVEHERRAGRHGLCGTATGRLAWRSVVDAAPQSTLPESVWQMGSADHIHAVRSAAAAPAPSGRESPWAREVRTVTSCDTMKRALRNGSLISPSWLWSSSSGSPSARACLRPPPRYQPIRPAPPRRRQNAFLYSFGSCQGEEPWAPTVALRRTWACLGCW